MCLSPRVEEPKSEINESFVSEQQSLLVFLQMCKCSIQQLASGRHRLIQLWVRLSRLNDWISLRWEDKTGGFLIWNACGFSGLRIFWKVTGEKWWGKNKHLNTNHEDERRRKFTSPIFWGWVSKGDLLRTWASRQACQNYKRKPGRKGKVCNCYIMLHPFV